MAADKIKKQTLSAECILACIYFVCLPFTVVTTPFGSLLKVVTMPVVIVLLIRMFMGKSDLCFNYIHFFYALYVIYTVFLLLVYSADAAVTQTKDMALGILMLLLITMRIYNEREKNLMETAWLIVGIVCIYICISSKEVVSEAENRAVVRVFGYEEDQNQFCAYLIMPVLISVKRMFKQKKLWFLYALIAALAFYSVLKTGSRGGLIGVLAGLLVYILIGIKSIKAKTAVVLCAVLTVFVFYAAVMPNLPADVQSRYSIAAVREDGGSGRFEIWTFLIDYTMQRPERMIRGSGVLSTQDIMYAAGLKNGVAHNAFIQILNDEGLIGLILFLAVIISCLVRTVKKEPLYASAMTALLAFSMSLTFYVFKPYLNIMMMCAMSFEGALPEDKIKSLNNGGKNNA